MLFLRFSYITTFRRFEYEYLLVELCPVFPQGLKGSKIDRPKHREDRPGTLPWHVSKDVDKGWDKEELGMRL